MSIERICILGSVPVIAVLQRSSHGHRKRSSTGQRHSNNVSHVSDNDRALTLVLAQTEISRPALDSGEEVFLVLTRDQFQGSRP